MRKNGHVLDESFLTLAEMLSARELLTAAFVSSDRHFGPGGMDQGFAFFEEPRLAEGRDELQALRAGQSNGLIFPFRYVRAALQDLRPFDDSCLG